MAERLSARNALPGTVVYHNLFVFWGKGVIREKHPSIFARRSFLYVIDFERRVDPVRTRDLRGLRRTPNRRKILEMVAFYRARGVEAVDGGDVLIIPRPDDIGQTVESETHDGG